MKEGDSVTRDSGSIRTPTVFDRNSGILLLDERKRDVSSLVSSLTWGFFCPFFFLFVLIQHYWSQYVDLSQ